MEDRKKGGALQIERENQAKKRNNILQEDEGTRHSHERELVRSLPMPSPTFVACAAAFAQVLRLAFRP